MPGRALERELGVGAFAGAAAVVDGLERVAGERALAEVVRELVEPGIGAVRVARFEREPTCQCMRTRRLVVSSSYSAERTSACANV